MKLDPIKIFATFFGIGYLPYCPGTWASLAGAGIFFLLRDHAVIYICISVIILVLGLLICRSAEQRFGRIDPPFIVIDEVAAILIVFIFVPRNILLLVLGFFTFRVMDILKPFPIKKIENLSGSWSIMGDDLAAGFYAIVFVRLVDIIILLGKSGG
jgi:phosphatidylglycerophosphatase A